MAAQARWDGYWGGRWDVGAASGLASGGGWLRACGQIRVAGQPATNQPTIQQPDVATPLADQLTNRLTGRPTNPPPAGSASDHGSAYLAMLHSKTGPTSATSLAPPSQVHWSLPGGGGAGGGGGGNQGPGSSAFVAGSAGSAGPASHLVASGALAARYSSGDARSSVAAGGGQHYKSSWSTLGLLGASGVGGGAGGHAPPAVPASLPGPPAGSGGPASLHASGGFGGGHAHGLTDSAGLADGRSSVAWWGRGGGHGAGALAAAMASAYGSNSSAPPAASQPQQAGGGGGGGGSGGFMASWRWVQGSYCVCVGGGAACCEGTDWELAQAGRVGQDEVVVTLPGFLEVGFGPELLERGWGGVRGGVQAGSGWGFAWGSEGVGLASTTPFIGHPRSLLRD